MHARFYNIWYLIQIRSVPKIDKSSMVCLLFSLELFDVDLEIFSFSKWIHIIKVTVYQISEKSTCMPIYLWSYSTKFTFQYSIQTVFFYLCWIIIVLPCTRSSSNYFCMATSFFFCSVYSLMHLPVVKFIIRHLFTTISERHCYRTHSKRIHFICTYNFSMRTDKFFNVIWMCHNHFFTFKTIP